MTMDRKVCKKETPVDEVNIPMLHFTTVFLTSSQGNQPNLECPSTGSNDSYFDWVFGPSDRQLHQSEVLGLRPQLTAAKIRS